MPDVSINYFAVIVAALVHMAIGALWYSPLLFGSFWMSVKGLTKKDMEKEKKEGKMGKTYLLGFIGSLLTAFVLAHFVDFTGAITAAQGIQTALWIWLGFILTSTLSDVLWEKKDRRLYLLYNSYQLVAMMVIGAILATWT